MPSTKRRHEPTDDWEQHELLSRFPKQLKYEQIRMARWSPTNSYSQ